MCSAGWFQAFAFTFHLYRYAERRAGALGRLMMMYTIGATVGRVGTFHHVMLQSKHPAWSNRSDTNRSDTNRSDTNRSDTNRSDTNRSDANRSDW
jgi:hypothetical protein